MIGLAAAIVARGVGAIERVAKVLMPSLIVLVVILVIRALLLPGAADGIGYLFSVDWGALTDARIWIEALTQNAWDTGAGWGLVLCYAAYQREREDTALNAFLLPAGNNLISLLAGIMVFCTVFSAVPPLLERGASDPSLLQGLGGLERAATEGTAFSAELMQETVFAEGNTGITFVWMPQLFRMIPGGAILMVLFFVALAVAAFTSLIAMVELATRAFQDAGYQREKAIWWIGGVGFLLGLPSALHMGVLDNQDWVWSVSLMLSGLFYALAVGRHGAAKFRSQMLNHKHSDIRIGRWWDVVICVVVPIEATGLAIWMLYQAWRDDPIGWLRPFGEGAVFSVGTVLLQLGLLIVILAVCNRRLASTVSGDTQ